MARWSDVWKHYTIVTELDELGKSIEKAKCNYCPKTYKINTTNMLRHYETALSNKAAKRAARPPPLPEALDADDNDEVAGTSAVPTSRPGDKRSAPAGSEVQTSEVPPSGSGSLVVPDEDGRRGNAGKRPCIEVNPAEGAAREDRDQEVTRPGTRTFYLPNDALASGEARMRTEEEQMESALSRQPPQREWGGDLGCAAGGRFEPPATASGPDPFMTLSEQGLGLLEDTSLASDEVALLQLSQEPMETLSKWSRLLNRKQAILSGALQARHSRDLATEESKVKAKETEAATLSAKLRQRTKEVEDLRKELQLLKADQQQAIKHLAQMVTLNELDPSLVQGDNFRNFVTCLCPEFKMPSSSTIHDKCRDILGKANKDVLDRIKDAPGEVSLAVRTATVLESGPGEVKYMVCHFIDGQWKPHKLVLHACMASHDDFLSTIQEQGIVNKLSMVVYNEKDASFQAQLTQIEGIRCTAYADDVLHIIARSFLPCFPAEIRGTISRSSEGKQKHQQLLSDHGLDYVWPNHEGWYAYYCYLQIYQSPDYTTDSPTLGLRIELLRNIWEKIYTAIGRISDSSHPTSNLCLQVLLDVWNCLAKVNGEANQDELLARVLEEARSSLDKMIHKSYLIWSIPVLLDPRRKLQHIERLFRGAFDSDKAGSMISQVTSYSKGLYICLYENANINPLEQGGSEYDRYIKDDPINDPPCNFDILKWWNNHSSEDSKHYPTVALMARDVLSMPTCSKLSSDEIKQVKSILCGYSKTTFQSKHS